MKSLLRLIRGEADPSVQLWIAETGTKPTLLEMLAFVYLGAPLIMSAALRRQEKEGALPKQLVKAMGGDPRQVEAAAARTLCDEFLRVVDRMDADTIIALGEFLKAAPREVADRFRRRILVLKATNVTMTAIEVKEHIGYRGEIANVYKLMAWAGYQYAPGQRGPPGNSCKKGRKLLR